MEIIDDRHSDGNVDSDNECDHRRLLLKKNLSWTNGNSFNCSSISKLNSLKTSRSNPHVLDSVSSNVRSLASSSLKLATSQFISKNSQTSIDVRVAPNAQAISASTLTAATTHQTLATPTSIQLNIQPKSDFKFHCRTILRHCKVNSQLTRTKFAHEISQFFLFIDPMRKNSFDFTFSVPKKFPIFSR